MPSYSASGQVGFGGSASVQVIIPYTASGTLRTRGTADVLTSYHEYEASGSLRLGDSVGGGVSSPYWVVTATGGLKLRDSAIRTSLVEASPQGKASFGGSAPAKITFYYEASGGLNTNVESVVVAQQDVKIQFTWDISQGVLRTWRVEGKCRPSNHPCPPTSNQDPGCPPNGSTMQYVANIQAHSITDLCRRLKARDLLGPIKKIQMWSLPAIKDDWTATDSESCNKLTTVNFSNIPECIDFTVTQDLYVTAKVKAQVIQSADFTYVASGGLGCGGSAAKPISSHYSYTASGGLNAGGSTPAQSPQYYIYVASGGLGSGGSANSYGSYYGVLNAGGTGGNMKVMDLGIVFGRAGALDLEASDEQIAATCCTDLNLPQILFVRHELNRSDPLSNFLKVNGFRIPPIIKLMYNQQRNSWHYNKQFRGMSVDQDSKEAWNVIFEFGCLTENALLGVPADVWGFSVMVRRVNLVNSRVDLTRLVLEFDPVRVCNVSGTMQFNFTFNKQLLTTTPSVIRTLVFNDEIGSFIGSSYRSNPITSFSVSASSPSLGVGMFDQSVPFQNMLLSGR